jgi:hypothetical protein
VLKGAKYKAKIRLKDPFEAQANDLNLPHDEESEEFAESTFCLIYM